MEPTQQLTLHVPVYVWPLVGALVLGWIYTLLPDKYKKRTAKPDSNYLQLKHDLDVAGPMAGPAATPAKAAAPAMKWTLDLLRSFGPDQLADLVGAFWLARLCTVDSAGNVMRINRPSTGRLFAVAQVSAASSPKVTLEQIKALFAIVHDHSAPLGLYYGLSGFTPEALAFAKDKPLKLLMGSDLLAEIGHLKPEQQNALMERTTAGQLAAA